MSNLQVFESKDLPYLHTGHSLIFVIARNGMVWGKRLDEQSSKGDIELEVFWPREDGCLVRQWTGLVENEATVQATMRSQLALKMFSREQERKIESILSQKEIIQYELGTLMVQPCPLKNGIHTACSCLPEYRRVVNKECRLVLSVDDDSCIIKVLDCSYLHTDLNGWCYSHLLPFSIRYNDTLAQFEFFGEEVHFSKRFQFGNAEKPENFSKINKFDSHWKEPDGKLLSQQVFVSTLSNKNFDISGFRIDKAMPKIKAKLQVMYGEFNFFDYFSVDDALLILTYQTTDATLSWFRWVMVIAKNKFVREMMRLASNNPDLFEPLFQQDKYRKLM